MTADSAANRINAFRLTRDEAVALTSMQAYMMLHDVRAEGNDELRAEKTMQFNRWTHEAVTAVLGDSARSDASDDDYVPRDGPEASGPGSSFNLTGEGWEGRFRAGLTAASHPRRPTYIATSAPAIALNITDRPRALLLLIELYSFHPWQPRPAKGGLRGRLSGRFGTSVKWVSKTRYQSLLDLTQKMPPLTESDLQKVKKQFRSAEMRLKRKATNWWKVAAFAGAGMALGAVTLGLAAPIIGGALGAAMGLSGAAATSAGLAALGGGALTAGGLGMAGGTMVLAGIGGIAVMPVAAGTAYGAGLTAGQIVVETIKLEVLTRLVIIEEQGQDEVARLVVVALEQRLRDVEASLERLATELRSAASNNKELRRKLEEQIKETEVAREQLELTLEQLKKVEGDD